MSGKRKLDILDFTYLVVGCFVVCFELRTIPEAPVRCFSVAMTHAMTIAGNELELLACGRVDFLNLYAN
jgi:hypothetical protein